MTLAGMTDKQMIEDCMRDMDKFRVFLFGEYQELMALRSQRRHGGSRLHTVPAWQVNA